MYKLTKHTTITRLADNASIPFDEGNRDYQKYLEWLAKGNTPEPAQSLAEVKAEKLQEFTHKRQQASVADVTVAGKVYPADSEYREVISNLVSRSSRGKPLPATLRGKDGVPVALTPVLLGNIEDAIAAQSQTAWDRYWSRFDEVQAATSVEAVVATVW